MPQWHLPSATKNQLRQQCKAIRKELGDEFRRQASQAICARLATWDVFRASNVILTYMPLGTEVDCARCWPISPKSAGYCRASYPEKTVAWFFTRMIPIT
jgi:hypothetical protein